MGNKAVQDFQDLLSSYIGTLFLQDIMNDREALENEAMKAVCACRYYDLADTLNESPVADLLAIITGAVPCEICGE
jgi:hypothetical protein